MSRPTLPQQRRPELVPAFVQQLEGLGPQSVAVFDADGTLWRNDVADDFTQWMIAQGHIRSGARWEEYLRIYRRSPAEGCRFLLSFFAGLTLEQLRAHVRGWWERHAARDWIPETVETLHFLAERRCPVWVVSGSPSETMRPLLELLPVERILGMDVVVDAAGVVTGELDGILCADEGKADKVRATLGPDQRVVFAAGNAGLDHAMLAISEGVSWGVHPNPELEALAAERGWFILPRPGDFVEESKLEPNAPA
jgi:HAD superfamily phosphoserine phosphatase-like hydrolase